MRSILFFVPHAVGPLPMFGFGWLLIAVVIAWFATLIYRRSRGVSWNQATSDWLGWCVIAGVLVWLMPRVETTFPDGQGDVIPIGLPIRGYGLFLMLGVISAVWITSLRSQWQGLGVDGLISLSFVTVLGGVIGARLFFVIQKWSELPGSTLIEKLMEAVKFTEGGLVVFGSFIGGALAVIVWSWRRRYRLLVMGDLIVPGLMMGLALGRLGCLMNGCCYGGISHPPLPGISFPSGSLPYMEQLLDGSLLGMTLEGELHEGASAKIKSIQPGSWADMMRFKIGDRVEQLHAYLRPPAVGKDPAGPSQVEGEVTVAGQVYRLGQGLPARSLPTHPTQLYAALNAALICGFLFFLWPNVGRDGVVLGAWLVMCGVSRMLEEWIRIDEKGQFGTSLTISQWISLLGIVGGSLILAYVWTRPVGRAGLVT